MKQILFALILVALTATACAPGSPTPTVTLVPVVTRTRTPLAPASPPMIDTPAAPGVSSITPVATPTLIPSMTPPPTPTLPAGLFVTNLRIDPNPPTRGTDLVFYPTFVNTTGSVQNYKWIVYVYRSDTPSRTTGESTALQSAIPVGTNEVKGAGNWKIGLGGPCEYFFARVAWLNQDNQPKMFTRPDGQVYEKGFTVCAPSDLPSPTPGPTAAPTATPTFAPGLFVIDVVTEPTPPTRGADLNFIVQFVNTIGNPQDVKWNVYVYKPGERNAYGEATTTSTIVAIGINDYRVLGSWKLPLGGPCEDYVVRVGQFTADRVQMFTGFESKVFEKTLRICPP